MHNLKTINKLLKDELSATETYQQALDQLRKEVGLAESVHLMPIFADHKDAVSRLQAHIRQLGGTPSEDSGAWGTWAELVQGAANMLGKEAALKALQDGEINGEEDYQEALQDTNLPSDLRALIETKLLPAQQSHVRTLERLLEAAA